MVESSAQKASNILESVMFQYSPKEWLLVFGYTAPFEYMA